MQQLPHIYGAAMATSALHRLPAAVEALRRPGAGLQVRISECYGFCEASTGCLMRER